MTLPRKQIPILTRFGGTFGMLRLNQRSFFNALLGFTRYFDYKPTSAIHAGSTGVLTSDKILNSSTVYKIRLKSDVPDGPVVKRIQEPRLFSFASDEPSGYKVFCEPEIIQHKKNKSVLINKPFYIEDDNNEEVNFNQEILTFTLQMIKI